MPPILVNKGIIKDPVSPVFPVVHSFETFSSGFQVEEPQYLTRGSEFFFRF